MVRFKRGRNAQTLAKRGDPNGMAQSPWAAMEGRKHPRSNLALDKKVEPEDRVVLAVVQMEAMEDMGVLEALVVEAVEASLFESVFLKEVLKNTTILFSKLPLYFYNHSNFQ